VPPYAWLLPFFEHGHEHPSPKSWIIYNPTPAHPFAPPPFPFKAGVNRIAAATIMVFPRRTPPFPPPPGTYLHLSASHLFRRTGCLVWQYFLHRPGFAVRLIKGTVRDRYVPYLGPFHAFLELNQFPPPPPMRAYASHPFR